MTQTALTDLHVSHPPRFWWLKRLALAGVALVVALGGLRAWWGHHAANLLAAEHHRLRAAGEPILPEDLQPAPVAPHRNAAAFIQRATLARDRKAESPSNSPMEYAAYPPYSAKWHKLADAAVAANGPVFPLLRQARACDEVDWGLQFRSPLFRVRLPMLHHSRQLANLAGDAALREHVRGNDAAALELVRDVQHLSYATSRQPFLVSYQVAIGLDALALHRLMVMAPGMDVTAGDDVPVGGPVPDGPATRGQVEALIDQLLREPASPNGLEVALRGERVMGVDYVRTLTRGNLVLRPMFRLEERRVITMNDRYIAAATRPTAARADGSLAPSGTAEERRVSTAVSAAVTYSLESVMRHHLRLTAERRFAAVSLATRLYRIDHDGAWPASLDALVPTYLPAVPADPFAPDGRRLGYLLHKGATPLWGVRPIVYSVGDDGVDDTASGAMPLAAEPQYGWERGPDQHRDLSRWLPLPDLEQLRSTLLGVNDDEGEAQPE